MLMGLMRFFLFALLLARSLDALEYPTKAAAVEAVHFALFGEDELMDTWPRSRTPPNGQNGNDVRPVEIQTQVFVEKLKIDSREQEATLKWWLRQQWTDFRLSWNPDDYQYRDGAGLQGVTTITRGDGFWKPDTVIYESHDHHQSNAFGDSVFLAEIDSTGSVFYSQPQQIMVHMAPAMNMTYFPFDYETISFSIGSWTTTTDIIDYTIMDTGLIALPGFDCLYKEVPVSNDPKDPWGAGLACNFDKSESETISSVNTPRFFALSEEWHLTSINQLRVEKIYVNTNTDLVYAELNGRIIVRRYSAFYMNFVIIPNIFITMIGFAAHSFRGHTAGSVTFITGTGFTVALALVAQNLFLVEVIPVITQYSFLEFVFIFSFGLSLLATCCSLYLYKQTEGREENDYWSTLENRSWVTMLDSDKRNMRLMLALEVLVFPIFGLVYTLGISISAATFGAFYWEVGGMLVYMMLGLVICCVGAAMDCWRSADMKYAPNRPLKRYIRLKLRSSRLYKALWSLTSEKDIQERQIRIHQQDPEIGALASELDTMQYEVSKRIEAQLFYHGARFSDMKEEERNRLMAEIDRINRLKAEHQISDTMSPMGGNPAQQNRGLAPALSIRAPDHSSGGLVHANSMTHVDGFDPTGALDPKAYGIPSPNVGSLPRSYHHQQGSFHMQGSAFGAPLYHCEQTHTPADRSLEEMLDAYHLSDAAEALRDLGATSEDRLRRFVTEEDVEGLPLPPVTRRAVKAMLEAVRDQL